MAQITTKINDQALKKKLDALTKDVNREVFTKQVMQSLGNARGVLIQSLKSSNINSSGRSQWSQKYGKLENNIRQSSTKQVEKNLNGNVNLFYDARLRWLEKGTYKSNPRLSNKRGKNTFPPIGKNNINYSKPRFKQGKSFGTINQYHFLVNQASKLQSTIYDVFNNTQINELNKKIK